MKINNRKPHLKCSPEAKEKKFLYTHWTLEANRKRCTLNLLQKEILHDSHVPFNNSDTEKFDVRQFPCCMNIIEGTYGNPDCIAYYIPGLMG